MSGRRGSQVNGLVADAAALPWGDRQELDIAGEVSSAFEVAAERAGELIETSYSVGGLVVRVRFAGQKLIAGLTPALSHLRTADKPVPDLTLNVWDVASTGTSPPLLFPAAAAEEPPDPQVGHAEGAGSYYHYRGAIVRALYQATQQSLSLLTGSTAWYCFGGGEVPYWERAAPFRQIFNWWLAEHGVQQVHGGAVGTSDGGVLLVGRGGSGKSTTSLCALRAGLEFAGDDYVAIRCERGPYVHSLYCSAKLHAGHLARFPELQLHAVNRDRLPAEKALLFASDVAAASVSAGFPLRALMLPTIVPDQETTVVPVSKAAALTALAPSTVVQLHTAGQQELTAMAALVRLIPCYRLKIGADLDRIGPAIKRFLDESGAIR